jgi:hypothetical protein
MNLDGFFCYNKSDEINGNSVTSKTKLSQVGEYELLHTDAEHCLEAFSLTLDLMFLVHSAVLCVSS